MVATARRPTPIPQPAGSPSISGCSAGSPLLGPSCGPRRRATRAAPPPGGEHRDPDRGQRRQRQPIPAPSSATTTGTAPERSSPLTSRARKKAGKSASRPRSAGSAIRSPANTPSAVPPPRPDRTAVSLRRGSPDRNGPLPVRHHPRGVDHRLAIGSPPQGAAAQRRRQRDPHRQVAGVQQDGRAHRRSQPSPPASTASEAELGRAREDERRHRQGGAGAEHRLGDHAEETASSPAASANGMPALIPALSDSRTPPHSRRAGRDPDPWSAGEPGEADAGSALGTGDEAAVGADVALRVAAVALDQQVRL